MNNIYLAVIEVTNQCNLRCKHCYGEFFGDSNLSARKFKIIAKELKENGVEIVYITGGEPLLLGNILLNYFNILHRKGINDVRLLTNGILIEEIENRVFLPWSRIQVSLDGLEKRHNYIRGDNTFIKTLRGIKKLKRLGKKVDVMFTINNINFRDYKLLYELCKSESLNFAIEIYTKNKSTQRLDSITEKQYKEILNFCLINNIPCNDPLLNVVNKKKRETLLKQKEICGCLAGISAITIDAEGNVFPCPRIRKKMGNIFMQKLNNIILKSSFVKKNTSRNFSGKCGKCRYKYICGGCRALAYSLSGNIFGENSYCFLNKS